jgi:hypothetical protein
MRFPRAFSSFLALIAIATTANAQVVINEIHYHPVEEPAFNLNGTPVLDLTEDVHEFVEIRNIGVTSVDLSGWTLDDGVTFTFPAGTNIVAGGFRVIAKNPARIQTVYGIAGVLGPYTGVLSNNSDTVKLKESGGLVVDSVGYDSSSPWPNAADGLGAGSAFQGFSLYPYQYKGRSLERVSATAPSNDAANWLASPLSPGPSPGTANAVSLAVPKPVVLASTVVQSSDESPTIRALQPVKVDVLFSSTAPLSEVSLEWFLDDINSTAETRTLIAMMDLGAGRWTTSSPVPGQADRSIVRWRIQAKRGSPAAEIVFPRTDDAQIAPIGIGGVREAWAGYFVEPLRSSTKPIYDFFISTANVATLNTNISQNPRRVLGSGYPRDDPKDGYFPPNGNYNPGVNYPAAGQPEWDGVVPGVFVRSGVVYDIVGRYHGSRYQRAENKNSWKFTFPASKLMDRKQRILVTEKGSATVLGLALFHEAAIPAGYSQFVDFYKNSDNATQRCEISDADEETVSQYQREQEDANPQNPPVFNGLGIIYKSKGLDGNEGPFGWANGQPMPATGVWTSLDRYIHSFPSQLNDWRGLVPLKTMVDGVWNARGDAALLSYPSTYAGSGHGAQTNVAANVANLRAYLAANWDVDKMLTYLAVRNWCSPWDDKFHNHYVYLQPDNKWTMVPWDFDGEMSGGATGDAGYNNSIFAGRKDDLQGAYSNNSRGPNWYKDHFLRAYEAEYKQRLFILNNTLLAPSSVAAIAGAYATNVPDANWLINRQTSVNTQCGLGSWFAPGQPTNTAPAAGSGIVPPFSFTTSAYTHTSGNTSGANAHTRTRWEIRRSTGNYRVPIYNVTSTTALTSLAVPFDLLDFGQTYYWRATHIDASGHPSAPSAETAFGFGPQPSNITVIGFDDTWKYNHTLSFANNTWALPAYDDSGWSSGQGVLAAEPNGVPGPGIIRTTLPAPGTLTPVGRAYYFRKRFTFPGNPATSTIRIRHLIDDGCVIWINGQLVHRFLFNAQANYATGDYSTATPPPGGEATYQFADAITGTATWAYVDPRPFLVQGENVIAVEVHQNGAGSSDVVFGLEMTGTVISSGGDVALNEILADNRNAVTNGASSPDYVEIRNNTASAVSLNGWSLTDDVLSPGKYAFPNGTSIPPAGRLVVWCDKNSSDPGLHTGFGLSLNGQTLALFQGQNLRDYVTFGPQAPNLAIGRVTDGVGNWTLVVPSPGTANAAVSLGVATTLKVNEWMAAPFTGEDWFEIHNTGALPVSLAGLWLSDTAGSAITQVPDLSFIGARGFTRFEADGLNDGANHANFKLSTSGDGLYLLAGNKTTILDSVSFGSQATGTSQGRLPDGAATTVSFPRSASPASSNWIPATVVINEALANSVAPLTDRVELQNTGASAANIGGWWLSDDRSNLQKYQIPAGTTLNAGAFLILEESQFNAGANAFSLSSLGDELILSAVDGGGNLTGSRAQVSFGPTAENTSLGRVLTGSPAGSWLPEFWPQVSLSFGGANTSPVTVPAIINEVMYHPPDQSGSDNVRDEFIELHNPTTSPLDLSGWVVKGDADFAFAPGTILRPGDYMVLVGFNPSTDPGSLAAFRSIHGLGTGTPILGPYSSKLANSTGNIELARPGMPVGGITPLLLVDKLEYGDFAPWPSAPDGAGPSLQRISRAVIGNDPANWNSGAATPGAVNPSQSPILDNDGDGLSNAFELANNLDPFNAADAAMDSDGDGRSNLAEFIAGTSIHDAADFFAAQVAKVAGGYTITFVRQAGKTYTIQYRDSLGSGTWLELTDVAASGTTEPFTHTDTTTQSQRFYRIATPQQ